MASSTDDGWVSWSSTSICTYNVEAFPLGHFPTWSASPSSPHTRFLCRYIDFKVVQFCVGHPRCLLGRSVGRLLLANKLSSTTHLLQDSLTWVSNNLLGGPNPTSLTQQTLCLRTFLFNCFVLLLR